MPASSISGSAENLKLKSKSWTQQDNKRIEIGETNGTQRLRKQLQDKVEKQKHEFNRMYQYWDGD